jgi:hypothetical protein
MSKQAIHLAREKAILGLFGLTSIHPSSRGPACAGVTSRVLAAGLFLIVVDLQRSEFLEFRLQNEGAPCELDGKGKEFLTFYSDTS